MRDNPNPCDCAVVANPHQCTNIATVAVTRGCRQDHADHSVIATYTIPLPSLTNTQQRRVGNQFQAIVNDVVVMGLRWKDLQ